MKEHDWVLTNLIDAIEDEDVRGDCADMLQENYIEHQQDLAM